MRSKKTEITPLFRVAHLRGLPAKCGWEEINEIVKDFKVESKHIFNNQALIQFETHGDALKFITESKGVVYIKEAKVRVQFSNFPVLNSSAIALFSNRVPPSPVICIQLIHLRMYIGITDIYDECAPYGTIKKIICFSNNGGKFALVQMGTQEEAASALANLFNNHKRIQCYQIHAQYSKNCELIVKNNNSRSFDFTLPGAKEEFAKLRDPMNGEAPFFAPDENSNVPEIFHIWSPVHFDPSYPEILCVSNLDELNASCMPLRNLFVQYGHVQCVKIIAKNKRTAFIQMSTGFFARIAALFLHDCPFMGRKLQISFSAHNDVTQPTEPDSADLYAYYGPGPNDYSNEVYEQIYFPSKYVSVKGRITAKELTHATKIGKVATAYEAENAIKFPEIDDAAKFISAYNGLSFKGSELSLQFMRPSKE